MNIGTSNSVDTAIHFLYGKNPKINIENAEGLLEVAEFLMIEELKAKCIELLKTVLINMDNCLKLLLLCSGYNFCLEDVSDFILSHLPDLFSKEELMLLDKESVRLIVTDPMLLYVTREDCFRFIVKWCSQFPNRRSHFAELFSCLDKDDIGAEVLNTISLDSLSQSDQKLCKTLSTGSERLCNVLIAYPPKYSSGNYFLHAYNVNSRCWFQLLIKRYNCWPTTRKISVRNQNTVVNLKSHKIAFYDILTRNEIEKNIEIEDEESRITFHKAAANDNTICCVKNLTHYYESKKEAVPTSIDVVDLFKRPALYGFNDMLALQLLAANTRRRRQSKNVCSIYVAKAENEDKVIMRPVISVYGSVASLCVTNDIVCLLVPEKDRLMLYEEGRQRIKKLDLSMYVLEDTSYVRPNRYGGIYVVTKSHILQIDLQIKSSEITARLSEFLIPKQEKVDDWWSRDYPPKFEVLPEIIITIEKSRNNYKSNVVFQILPEKINYLDKEKKNEIELPEKLGSGNDIHFMQTLLPKEKLRCPIGCPHCRYEDASRTRHTYRRDSEPDEYYDDDYGESYYFDSSDYYYDSSD